MYGICKVPFYKLNWEYLNISWCNVTENRRIMHFACFSVLLTVESSSNLNVFWILKSCISWIRMVQRSEDWERSYRPNSQPPEHWTVGIKEKNKKEGEDPVDFGSSVEINGNTKKRIEWRIQRKLQYNFKWIKWMKNKILTSVGEIGEKS